MLVPYLWIGPRGSFHDGGWGRGGRCVEAIKGGVGRCGEAGGGWGREVWGSRWRVG